MRLPESLNLHVAGHLSAADASRQRRSAEAILNRFALQPGVILGDEVGMGKTFVALAVAAAHVVADPARPVVVMVPSGVVAKWVRDAETFRRACLHSDEERACFRVGIAERGVDFLKLLDDPEPVRATLIIMSHGALHRKLADKWVKLAVLQAAIKGRHGVNELRQRLSRFAPMILGQTKAADERAVFYGKLLKTAPGDWKRHLVAEGMLTEADDDPVPQVLIEALERLDLAEVFTRVVDVIPSRKSANLKERIRQARSALDSADGGVLPAIWRAALKRIKLSLPLLILDEAHRARHAGTQLASLLAEAKSDLDAVGGQLAGRFGRMLFLTATPFQLGHAELRNVLMRFDAIDWSSSRSPRMGREPFRAAIAELHTELDGMQMTTERLERAWKRLLPADVGVAEHELGEQWWASPGDEPNVVVGSVANDRVRAVMLAFRQARAAIRLAEGRLGQWVLRSSRSALLPPPYEQVIRRIRIEGAGLLAECDGAVRGAAGCVDGGGLRVSTENALPFLLAARITTLPDGRRLFAEGIASSFEALLDTHRDEASEAIDGAAEGQGVGGRSDWYAGQLRSVAVALSANGDTLHPKVRATIDLAMSLWRKGEKVLIFCHFRQTGAALHRYLSEAMLREIEQRACAQLGCAPEVAEAELRRIAAYFDRDRPAAREVSGIVEELSGNFPNVCTPSVRDAVYDIVLRFLRTPTFLVRFADLASPEGSSVWVRALFDRRDGSGMNLKAVIRQFMDFLDKRSGDADRHAYLAALQTLQTGTHAGPEVAQAFDDDEIGSGERIRLVANVRRVYGRTRDETRQKIMLTFNTPFYPEILIASSVLAEGVDLHLCCRHVIHHDLDWNPSSLEQRTGRIDRLGAKAERSGQSIRVYLPYVEGCQDEKLFRVVQDRERWFGVVMGAEEAMSRVLKASAWEVERMASEVPVPAAMAEELRLRLSESAQGRSAAI